MTLTRERRPVGSWPDLDAAPPTGLGARIARRLFRSAIGRLDVTVHVAAGASYPAETLGRGGPEMHVNRPDELFARIARDKLIGFGEAYLTGAWDEGPDAPERCARRLPHRALLRDRDPRASPTAARCGRRSCPAIPRTHRGRPQHHAGERRAPLRPLQRPVRAVPRPDAVLLVRALRRPGDRATAAELAARPAPQDRPAARPGSASARGPGCWRSAPAGASWRSAPPSAAPPSTRSPSRPSSWRWRGDRIAGAGQADRVEVELLDYRALLESPATAAAYDAVVSVEMIEAVGWRFWPTYFRTLDHVLAPGGRVALQAITMPHDRMLATRDTHTFITKYIFPGGALPSVRAIEETAARHTRLRVVDQLPLGAHYARTLRLWDDAFTAAACRRGRGARLRRARSSGCGTSTWSTAGPGSRPATSTTTSSRSPGRTHE